MSGVEADFRSADANHGSPRQPAYDWSRHAAHAERGSESKRIIAGYGFWIFLLSDIVMFSAFFAAYAVLSGATAGGPAGRDLFDIHNTAIETACLLTSSFACGLAAIGARAGNPIWFYVAMAATFTLGAIFLGLEIHEFAGMVAQNDGPSRSAFLSAF
jgi:cytochrome o ubiquinol oxidase subunit 3